MSTIIDFNSQVFCPCICQRGFKISQERYHNKCVFFLNCIVRLLKKVISDCGKAHVSIIIMCVVR